MIKLPQFQSGILRDKQGSNVGPYDSLGMTLPGIGPTTYQSQADSLPLSWQLFRRRAVWKVLLRNSSQNNRSVFAPLVQLFLNSKTLSPSSAFSEFPSSGYKPCASSLASFFLPFSFLPFPCTSRDSCLPVRASLAEDGRWQRGDGTAVVLSAGVVSLPSLRMPNSLNPSPCR